MKGLFTILLILISSSPLRADDWETLENCRLARNDYFDGDSFRILHQNKEFIIRLYFVDCPETDDSFPGRTLEQAGHFGTTKEETLHVGTHATSVVRKLLSRRFTVRTKFEDAQGRSTLPRYFGFVTTADGDDLGEILVANGLARSYGYAADPPGQKAATLRTRYDRLEDKARRDRNGLYSPEPMRRINGGKALDLEKIPMEPEEEPTPVPQFANENAPPPPTAADAVPVSSASDQLEGKFNINTASKQELLSIPGIGPAIAERIITGRPYQSLDDLLEINGIGRVKLAEIESKAVCQ